MKQVSMLWPRRVVRPGQQLPSHWDGCAHLDEQQLREQAHALRPEANVSVVHLDISYARPAPS
jgi:hypothetical protein